MGYHIATQSATGRGCFLRLLLGRKMGYFFLLGSGIAHGAGLAGFVSVPKDERYTGYMSFKKDDPKLGPHICQSIYLFPAYRCRHLNTRTCFVACWIPSGLPYIPIGHAIAQEAMDLTKECSPLLSKFAHLVIYGSFIVSRGNIFFSRPFGAFVEAIYLFRRSNANWCNGSRSD